MHTAVETSPGAMKPTVRLGKRRVSYRSPTRAGRLRYSSSEKSHMVSSLSETNDPLSREVTPRACQQHGSKAYADYGFRVSALEALTLRQGRPPRQPSVIVSTKFDHA